MSLRLLKGVTVTVVCEDIDAVYKDLLNNIDDVYVLRCNPSMKCDTVVDYISLVKKNEINSMIILDLDKNGDIRPEYGVIYELSDLIIKYYPEFGTFQCIKDRFNYYSKVCKIQAASLYGAIGTSCINNLTVYGKKNVGTIES